MDVDARQDTNERRETASEKVVVSPPQRVRDLITPYCVESRIGENDFGTTVRRGVSLDHNVDVAAKRMRHG
jgi:hypothetical protein